MADKKVGKVSHFYDKINVAVVDVLSPLKVGDTVKFVKEDSEFTQEITSMQFDHKEIKTAKKGDSIGLKVDSPVKPGFEVFKTS